MNKSSDPVRAPPSRKKWLLVGFAVLCVLVAYYVLVAHVMVRDTDRTGATFKHTTKVRIDTTASPRRSPLSPPQVAFTGTQAPRGTPPPLRPRSGNVSVPCDAAYLEGWYGLSDEDYCTRLSAAIAQRLREGSGRLTFPVPNVAASERLAAMLEAQGRLHARIASGDEPMGQRYLIWSLSGGVGNRVQSLVSTFMTAMLSGRVLLMKDWFGKSSGRVSTAKRVGDLQLEELGPLFNASWRPNDALLCPAVPMMSLRAFQAVYPHYFSKAEYRSEHVKVDISARHDQSNKRWQRLLCNNLTDSFTQRFVYIWTNQYFLPLLFANPSHSAQMASLFPTSDAFGPLVRYLFLPHRLIMKRAHEFICRNFQGKRVVGLQVRAFRAGGMDTMATTFATCAKQIYAGTDTLYFVASMHKPVRDTLLKIFGADRVLFLDEARGHQFTGDVSHDREAISDMLILMHTGDFLLSPGSTFGLVAAGYRSYLPVRVHRSQVKGVCSRMVSSQPCFGSWLSYDFISQKSQQNVYTCKARPIPPELDNCVKT